MLFPSFRAKANMDVAAHNRFYRSLDLTAFDLLLKEQTIQGIANYHLI
jgi:hypothetical protein